MDASAGQPPRSAAAEASPQAARVARQRLSQPNGWWGMALFLCAEVTLFGSLMATYFYLDFIARRWPPNSIKPPSVTLPLIATAVLVTTTLPMLAAVRASRRGDRRVVIAMIVLAVIVQSAYLAAQVLLFRHDLRQFTPQGSAYGSIYFTLLAVHHAHVVLGILLELGVLWQVTARGLTNYWLIGVRAVALYWYVVNAVAILVVLTQLSPSL
jgi:heme/copper-type cytochrome/quinol oxidase subunit 3